jgi:hypothetical protein
MAEYIKIEKPFLKTSIHLKGNQPNQDILEGPIKSLNTDFKEVLMEKVFRESINTINLTGDGRSQNLLIATCHIEKINSQ